MNKLKQGLESALQEIGVNSDYFTVKDFVYQMSFSASDIQELVNYVACNNDLKEKAKQHPSTISFYISAAAQKIAEKERIIELDIRNLERNLPGIGAVWRTGKLKLITNDESVLKALGYIGMCMKGGEIEVNGNAGYFTGTSSTGGKIHVTKNMVSTNGVKAKLTYGGQIVIKQDFD
ncbi:hypothetical protein COX58_01515 [archaeon CG_4_10_14_0_2_um_filter_Archaea_38_6]|nr:MAG: hypothetical protein COS64_02590 [archaeon CG06_land_8_20_14_3_00_37_11]PJA22686.1 MAG: hypothetical protein COX58_01515 [archaeon CG_4_10_14_0_2_um_filter_Archaea_38_6]